jgi:hypothetical protein
LTREFYINSKNKFLQIKNFAFLAKLLILCSKASYKPDSVFGGNLSLALDYSWAQAAHYLVIQDSTALRAGKDLAVSPSFFRPFINEDGTCFEISKVLGAQVP